MKVSLILAAGGSGSRFKASLNRPASNSTSKPSIPVPPKLYFELAGEPLFAHTLRSFRGVREISEVVIAAPRSEHSFYRKLSKSFVQTPVKIVAGGPSRAASVWNAVRRTDAGSAWVLVHDGARPLVTADAVRKLLAEGSDADGALLAKKVVPTIKEVASDGQIRRTVDRSVLFEAETPQLARREVLMRAYRENPQALEATDEASLLESVGARVKVVENTSWNPKITTADDLALAEAYVSRLNPAEIRTGFGKDLHRLGKGRKLMLGGLRIPSRMGAVGHSDGDVLLHAVIDAILGVLGAGDIGDWFSDRDRRWKGIASAAMLKRVLKEASQQGWRLQHLDCTVALERPKLGPLKEKIRRKVALLTKLPASAVSVKAKTMEGLGPIGKGEALACDAVVTMLRRTVTTQKTRSSKKRKRKS